MLMRSAARLNNLALVRGLTGNYPEARALQEQAIAIYEATVGPDHLLVAYTLQSLTHTHLNAGNFTDALAVNARTLAIREAARVTGSERLTDCDLYVTLEPCSHTGRTPPCADALIAAGLARVVCAVQDPNPLVAGQGIARLQAAGIAVDVGVLAQDARQINIGFFTKIKIW